MTTEAPTERKFQISPRNRELLRKHAVNLRDGRFTPSGSFETTEKDVQELFQKHLPEAYKEARAKKKPLHLLFFAHGGTVTEEDAVDQALAHIPKWREAGIYPVFFVWETAVWLAIRDRLMGRPGDRGIGDFFKKIKDGAVNATDWTLEKVVRAANVDDVWYQMKLYAEHAMEPQRGGGWIVAAQLAAFLKRDGISAEQVKVHCLGHSAGAVFHSWFVPTLLQAGLGGVETLHLLAPAVTNELFGNRLLGLIGRSDGIGKLTMFTMDERTELADSVIGVYRKSLLYLISRALEPQVPTRILGLEESLRADRKLANLFNYPLGDGGDAELVFSPTRGRTKPGRASQSTAHGGFGNEPHTLNSIVFRIAGKDGGAPFPENFKQVVKDSTAERALLSTPPVTPAAPRRLALCIGIDDYPTAPLAGCVNDARLWQETFAELGFDSAGLLLNEQATYAGILDSLEQLVAAARPGDALVVQYAGHGTQLDDLDGDEEDDRLDEALVPYDYLDGKFILDDDIGRVFDKLAPGVGLTCFVDCCHSGTITRALGPAVVPAAQGMRERFIVAGEELEAKHRAFRDAQPAIRGTVMENMREVTFAACQPSQTAKENDGHGYFTLAATRLLRSGVTTTHAGLLKLLIDDFPLPPASQLPHLSCPPGTLELPLFQITTAEGAPAAAGTSRLPAATTTATDARLLMETMNRYLAILDRLTSKPS